jgi:hypothetical protein
MLNYYRSTKKREMDGRMPTVAVTIEIPTDIEKSLESHWPELSRKALEATALEGYRQGILSQGQVGRMLSLSFAETEAFLKTNAAPLLYDEDELRRDQETFEQLFP